MITLKNIISKLDIDIEVNGEIEIQGLNTLKDATSNQISFLENKRYLKDLEHTNACAVFITEGFKTNVPKNTIALVCDTPYISLAKASEIFAPKVIENYGEDCILEKGCIVQPNVYLGKNSYIDRNSTVMHGSFIGDNVTIGSNVIIYPNVTIYRDCIIGNNTIIHSGTVIGSDGFGFATTKSGDHIKIYQNGNVTIGNDVEIGANCTIDRAAFASTVIEDKVRIDNLVHIAHNCHIGKGSILVTQTGLSGSTILNEYVTMAGQSGTTGHLEIAPYTTISARGVVSKSITQPKKQWAGFPIMEHKTWLRLQSKVNRLLKKG